MFNIIYTSNADRDRLQFLQDSVAKVETKEEQQKMLQEIEEIKARQKPLHECNIEECTELRTTIWSKYEKLYKIGKSGHAIGFKKMLRQIEQRIAVLHMEMSQKEAERKKKPLSEKAKKDDGSTNETSKRKTTSRTGASRWTTGVGSLD